MTDDFSRWSSYIQHYVGMNLVCDRGLAKYCVMPFLGCSRILRSKHTAHMPLSRYVKPIY
jgi:hypothetical protein